MDEIRHFLLDDGSLNWVSWVIIFSIAAYLFSFIWWQIADDAVHSLGTDMLGAFMLAFVILFMMGVLTMLVIWLSGSPVALFFVGIVAALTGASWLIKQFFVLLRGKDD